MEQNILKCSIQEIKTLLKPLDEFKDFVFYIRSHDNTRQVYVSESYQTIWSQPPEILFELSFIWLEYLARENKISYMQQLQNRHDEQYLIHEKNIIYYQVARPNNEIIFVRDRVFKFQDRLGMHFIVGIAKQQSDVIWYSQNQNFFDSDDEVKTIYKIFFLLLKQNFGFTLLTRPSDSKISFNDYHEFIAKDNQLFFSKREMECLYYFCQGKTNKQVARVMAISPRTVETHLENIRIKSNASNKIEVVSRFSQHFKGKELILS